MMKNPPHPGELLREDVLQPLGIEVTEAAQRLGVSRTTLSRVINGRAGVSPDLAIRLERAGVSTARFWMTLQANYELAQAEQRQQPKVAGFKMLRDTIGSCCGHNFRRSPWREVRATGVCRTRAEAGSATGCVSGRKRFKSTARPSR
jgi:addiction module HigA family antidote